MINFDKFPNFGYWCQRVLPTVFDESLSYYEKVCKLEYEINQLIDDYNKFGEAVTAEINKFEEDVNNEIERFETDITNQFNQFKDDVSQQIQTFIQNVTNIVNDFKDEVNQKLAEQDADITAFKEQITQQQTEFESSINSQITTFKSEVNQTIETFKTEVNQTNQAFQESVNTQLSEQNKNISDFKSQISSEIESFESTVNGKINEFQTAINNIPTQITSGIQSEFQTQRPGMITDVTNAVKSDTVMSLNTLKGDVTLAAGTNVSLVPSGNTITVNATPGTGGVNTVNSIQGDVNIVAGSNVTVTPSGQNITISATGGGSTGGVTTLNSLTGAVNLTSSSYNDVEIGVSGNNIELSILKEFPNDLNLATAPGTYSLNSAQATQNLPNFYNGTMRNVKLLTVAEESNGYIQQFGYFYENSNGDIYYSARRFGSSGSGEYVFNNWELVGTNNYNLAISSISADTVSPGVYVDPIGALAISGLPSTASEAGILFSYGSGTTGNQVYFDTADPCYWVRSKQSGSWTDWKQWDVNLPSIIQQNVINDTYVSSTQFDLDSITDPGVYSFGTTGNIQGFLPQAIINTTDLSGSWMVVKKNNQNHTSQTLFYTDVDTTISHIYMRYHNGAIWKAWDEAGKDSSVYITEATKSNNGYTEKYSNGTFKAYCTYTTPTATWQHNRGASGESTYTLRSTFFLNNLPGQLSPAKYYSINITPDFETTYNVMSCQINATSSSQIDYVLSLIPQGSTTKIDGIVVNIAITGEL